MASTRHHAVGDRVRYMFYSFMELAKSECLLPHRMLAAAPDAADIMLGGAYDVLEVQTNQWGVQMYRLLNGDAPHCWAPGPLVFAAGDLALCPYRRTDPVYFAPASAASDVEVMVLSHPDLALGPGAGPYYVRRVINDYYINTMACC